MDTARAVIRTDTLQVYSRLLAQQTEAAVAGGSCEREKRRLCKLWNGTVGLLQSFVKLLIQNGIAYPAAGSEVHRLLDELSAALADSAILEHLSRALMLMAVMGAASLEEAADSEKLWHTCSFLGQRAADGSNYMAASCSPRQAHLRTVLSGRCLQHLMACQLVATLSAADGGTSYGMPGALLSGLQLLDSDRRPGLARRSEQTASRFLGRGLPLSVLSGTVFPSRLQPRRAFPLLLRTARVVMASMQPPGTQQQQGPPLRRLPFSAENSGGFASCALLACRSIVLGSLTACTPAGAPAAAAVAAPCPELPGLWLQWWQATLEYGEVAPSEEHTGLTRLLEVPLGPLPVPLSAAPHAPVSAALSAGILPWMERALRRAACPAGASGQGSIHLLPQAASTMGSLTSFGSDGGNFRTHLLAYGDPAAVAALVATMGKLLRHFMHRAGATDGASWQDLLFVQASGMLVEMQRLFVWLHKSTPTFLSSEPARVMEGPGHTLPLLLSYALVCWLPPLAELALADRPALWDVVETPSDMALSLILGCLASILPACAPEGLPRCDGTSVGCSSGSPSPGAPPGGEQAGPSSCAGPSAPPGPEPRVRSGWRAWLLREARAVEVVDAALRRRQDTWAMWGNPDAPCKLLAFCCLALAPACAAREREGTGSPALGGSASAWQGGVRMETLRALSARLAQPAGLRCLGPGAGSVVEWLEGRSAAADEQPGSSAGGGGTDGACGRTAPGSTAGGVSVDVWEMEVRNRELACRLLPPPEQLPGLLPLPPACDHPRCASLAGDSEAGVRLLACRGCGAARYCCRECQVAHWRAGHKEACGRGRGG